MKTILVTGGAGYIGSHAALYLVKKGYKVIILDNFVYDQIFNHKWATIVRADFADKNVLKEIFLNNQIFAVMHFAAHINVGESVKNPLKYYENNVSKTISLLEEMAKFNIKNFIFSSSCAVYGNVESGYITEDFPLNPLNPYGYTKLIIENVLKDLKSKINYVSLRYFNASGALPEFGLGEKHKPETHVIPLLFEAAKSHMPFNLYGDDYNTKDGTCVRDFLHVWDIANAHFLALNYLEQNNPSDCFNLGSGQGVSVRELIDFVEKYLKTKIKIKIENRREGDSPFLMADASKARNFLNWVPQCSSLDFIIKSAYAFENNNKIITNLNNISQIQKY